MTALLLIASCALLWSLESVVPLRRYGDRRFRRALPNIALTVLLLLTNLALAFLAAGVSGFVVSQRIGLFSVIEMPAFARLLVGVAALDLFAYFAHVTLHKTPFGWRFHRVHHSEEEVDVTTAFRQHPGESVWRIVWQLPAIALVGIPLWIVAVYLAISAINAQLEHANLRVPEPVDRHVRLLFVTPNMHKVHHSRRQVETDSNYANIFSFWDRLFGTFIRGADLAALQYGLDGMDEQAMRSLRGLLAMPFRSEGAAR